MIDIIRRGSAGLAVVMIALGGCGVRGDVLDPQPRAHLSDGGRTLDIGGRVDERMVAALRDMDLHRVELVRVESLGGTTAAALSIVDRLAPVRPVIDVVGPCVSACASYLLLPARRISVGARGVILFHNTAASLLRLGGSATSAPARGFFGDLARREERAYARAGVERTLLFEPQRLLQTVCFRDVIEAGSWKDMQYASTLDLVAFDDRTLQRLGLRVIGQPDDLAGVVARLTVASPRLAGLKVRYARSADLRGPNDLHQVSRC